MVLRQASQYVSVAHRPGPEVSGNNLRVDLEVEMNPDGTAGFSFEPHLLRVKTLLDHRCLFEDEPEFQGRASTLETITEFLARDLFHTVPAPDVRWSAVTVVEMDRFRCRAEPGSNEFWFMVRHRNLNLELKGPLDPATGRVVDLKGVLAHVDAVFDRFKSAAAGAAAAGGSAETPEVWGQQLFEALHAGLPALVGASVDLGCHEWVRLARSPATLR